MQAATNAAEDFGTQQELQLHPVHPGEMLLNQLQLVGVSIEDFARHIDVHVMILRNLVTRISSITAEMALRLEKSLGIAAAEWQAWQCAYDLHYTIGRVGRRFATEIKPLKVA